MCGYWAMPAEAHLNCNGDGAHNAAYQADCLANGDVLHIDDFEDGTYVCSNENPGLAINDGWNANPFIGTDPDGVSGAPGTCWVTAGGVGSSAWAADSGLINGGEGGVPTMSDHGLRVTITYGQTLRLRYYKRCVRSPQCDWTINTKLYPTINPFVGSGGIYFGATGAFPLVGVADPDAPGPCSNPTPDNCTKAYHIMDWKDNIGDRAYLFDPNQGNAVYDCNDAANNRCFEDGTQTNVWYYFEHEWKFNTNGSANGTYRFWMNRCGTSGVCTGSPHLQASYTGLQLLPAFQGNAVIGALWMEQYSSWNDTRNVHGRWQWDEIIVSKATAGPIGFAGASSDTAPPSSPTGVTVTQAPAVPRDLHLIKESPHAR
jgi:hypothetical protein